MSKVDSRTRTTIDEAQSLDYPSEYDDRWGQPAASHYCFSHEGNVMRWYLISNMPTSSSYKPATLASNYAFFPVKAPVTVDTTLEDWDTLSDEALAALYADAAEEDQLLAQLGLAHYAEILRQEEESE